MLHRKQNMDQSHSNSMAFQQFLTLHREDLKQHQIFKFSSFHTAQKIGFIASIQFCLSFGSKVLYESYQRNEPKFVKEQTN
eukprot:CCRYP_002572-RA/>CCRYP_002572-RA protein AED:0.10 eAED:1.00 QI:0/0/0/1/0/0/2/0/80